MKNVTSTVSRTLSHGENTTISPCKTANVVNNYFASVADTAKWNINCPHRHVFEYLKRQCNNSIFIQPTYSEEIANIISSLNINKLTKTWNGIFLNNLQIYLIFLFLWLFCIYT